MLKISVDLSKNINIFLQKEGKLYQRARDKTQFELSWNDFISELLYLKLGVAKLFQRRPFFIGKF